MKVNKSEYLKKRKLEEELKISNEEMSERSLCLKCLRSLKVCFCHKIIPINTHVEFCILMHPKEAKREKVGTGRLAHLCLSNSRIITGINFNENNEVKKILKDEKYFPVLLYPGEDSLNISQIEMPIEWYKNKKLLVFVIDGTWPCAKTMMRESTILHGLQRISFTVDKTSKFSIKQQPAKFCLSTIESIYEVLAEFDRRKIENLNGKQQTLLNILDELVKFQIACAEDPSKKSYRRRKDSYSLPSERSYSKKWESWNICFEEKNYKK